MYIHTNLIKERSDAFLINYDFFLKSVSFRASFDLTILVSCDMISENVSKDVNIYRMQFIMRYLYAHESI
jgi:hypothetical protein